MKRIGKQLLLGMATLCLYFSAHAQDTIRVELEDHTTVMVVTKDKQALKQLKFVDFNALIEQVVKEVAATEVPGDSTIKYNYELVNAGDKSLLVRVDEEHQQDKKEYVHIVVRNNKKGKRIVDVRVPMDKADIEEFEKDMVEFKKDMEEFEKDMEEFEKDMEELSVDLGNKYSISVERMARDENTSGKKEAKRISLSGKNDTFKSKFRSSVLYLDLGVNNYLQDGSFPNDQNAAYAVRPLNSTYVGLGISARRPLLTGKNGNYWAVDFGLLWDWYNFKYKPSYYLHTTDTGVEWRDYEADFGKSLKKNKLVVSYVNVPVRLLYRGVHADGNRSFKFGIGGYVGYRVNAWTKIQPTGGAKIKNKDDFYLNSLRYGVEVQIGYGSVLLFAKYDLNTLFDDSQNIGLQPISFGIRL